MLQVGENAVVAHRRATRLAAYAGNRAVRMAFLGGIAGAMFATKINTGAFAGLALAITAI
jgi:hypothetical protein